MSTRTVVTAVLTVGCLALPWKAQAHGDLHGQIVAITAKIKRDAGNADLYLERAALYRAHREWRLSLADCDRALEQTSRAADGLLCRGLTLAASGRHADADRALSVLLASHPDITVARIARARTRVALGRPLHADPDYAAALARNPDPDWYIERAHALHRAKHSAAIDVLDEGIAALGPLVTLQDYAVVLDVEAGRYDAALRRVDRVLDVAGRSPAWLIRRAEILEQAGRPQDARVAFQATSDALEGLPQGRRQARAISDLISRVRAGLVRTGQSSPHHLR
jgi:tetratricopeptide (TPR) repeat protein